MIDYKMKCLECNKIGTIYSNWYYDINPDTDMVDYLCPECFFIPKPKEIKEFEFNRLIHSDKEENINE